MTVALFNREEGLHLMSHSTDGIIDHVPGAVYVPRLAGDPGSPHPLYLKQPDLLNPPKELLGRSKRLIEQFKKAYQALGDESMGILLTGTKGCGKTALAEKLAEWFNQQDLPVLSVDKRVPVELVKDFCLLCPNGCIVLIDEFEKTYALGEDEDGQNEFLSLLTDGRLKKTLFVFTVNEYNKVSEYIKDRPQRIKYRVDFQGLEEATALELLAQRNITGMASALMRCKAREADYYSSFDEYKTFCDVIDGCSSLQEVYERVEYLNVRKDILPIFHPDIDSEATEVNLEATEDNSPMNIRMDDVKLGACFRETGEIPVKVTVRRRSGGESVSYETVCFWSGEKEIAFSAGPVVGKLVVSMVEIRDWNAPDSVVFRHLGDIKPNDPSDAHKKEEDSESDEGMPVLQTKKTLMDRGPRDLDHEPLTKGSLFNDMSPYASVRAVSGTIPIRARKTDNR